MRSFKSRSHQISAAGQGQLALETSAALDQRYGPQSFGCHEALHATNLVLGLIERELADHGAIILQPDGYAHVRKAQDELSALYQKIGAAHL